MQGRECSDFQAFSLRALDRGIEREIDPTTTRSLMGSLYPMPGLHAKYFSVDQELLVEIVQDTVGRHDTFGRSCTARYYEDPGYPGHINCSDNMNRELARYAIRPRGGWPAINFFFNTLLDDTHAIGMDDPYSRPGDYVLLRR
ncbi:MAG: urea carboxylase-associated family protein [Paracoccaceae bacterium]